MSGIGEEEWDCPSRVKRTGEGVGTRGNKGVEGLGRFPAVVGREIIVVIKLFIASTN